MLASACLRDDAGLAHAACQHGLADGVVDLVRAGMVKVLALEVDLGATLLVAGACGVVDGGGAADEMCELVVELSQELGVVLVPCSCRARRRPRAVR